MKLWKKVTLGLLVLITGVGFAGFVYMQGLGDLRTEYVKKQGPSASAQKEGRALLMKSIEKLGGMERWKQLRERAVKVTFRHYWHDAMLRTFFMPLEFSGQELELIVRPKQSNARLTCPHKCIHIQS